MKPLEAVKSRPLEGGASFPLSNRLYRFLWQITWACLAAWTPPPFRRWRNLLLRLFGADVHPTAIVYGTTRVWYPPNLAMGAFSVMGPEVKCYCQDRITLGEKAIVSQGAHLCSGTHDISDPDFQLVTRPIRIERGAWIAAEAFIGPGVNVGEGAVVGARAVLFKDADPLTVYAGNPAVRIKARSFRDTRSSQP